MFDGLLVFTTENISSCDIVTWTCGLMYDVTLNYVYCEVEMSQ